MIAAAAALLVFSHPEAGAEVYGALQKVLDRSRSLELTESWDSPPERELRCKIVRPNRASKHGLGVSWWTDGTRTVENDDSGRVDRHAKADDLKHEMVLIGFESFYDPKAIVSAIGNAEPVSVYQRDYLLIDLKVNAIEFKLYLDAKTRLPAFYEEVKVKARTWYSDVRLGPPISKAKKGP